MSAIILIHGLATGERSPHDGRYVAEYTPDGHKGVGRLLSTADILEAKRYADAVEAMGAWKAVSNTHPIRLDGKPNRPLSAYTVEVLNL